MGSSILTRFALTSFVLSLTLIAWEGHVSWARYSVSEAGLGGVSVRRDEVRLRPPGASSDDELALPRRRFRGLGYSQLTPRWPFSLLVGEARRFRLVKVYMAEESGALVESAYGGGLDPLSRYLQMTRLLSANVLPRIEAQDLDLVLDQAPPRSLAATLTTTGLALLPKP